MTVNTPWGHPNYTARETTDDRPGRVAAIQRLPTAFLHSALYPGDSVLDRSRSWQWRRPRHAPNVMVPYAGVWIKESPLTAGA